MGCEERLSRTGEIVFWLTSRAGALVSWVWLAALLQVPIIISGLEPLEGLPWQPGGLGWAAPRALDGK